MILETNHKNSCSNTDPSVRRYFFHKPQSRIDLSGIEVSAVYFRSETHEKSACAFDRRHHSVIVLVKGVKGEIRLDAAHCCSVIDQGLGGNFQSQKTRKYPSKETGLVLGKVWGLSGFPRSKHVCYREKIC